MALTAKKIWLQSPASSSGFLEEGSVITMLQVITYFGENEGVALVHSHCRVQLNQQLDGAVELMGHVDKDKFVILA